MLRIKTTIMAVAAVLLLAGCGAKKNLTTTPVKDTKVTGEASASDLARGVFGNACYQSNVVSKLTFNLQTSGKNISVPGSLHMRWNDVIRLQLFLPILGTEVGRLEFTQDYVLIVDRIHKQYIKANYNEADFLKDKGINFHSLQALFWNKLFLPGHKEIFEDDLKGFTVAARQPVCRLQAQQNGMNCSWEADGKALLIRKANVEYSSKKHGSSSLVWTYDDFRAFGKKQFPYSQTLQMTTTATEKPRTVTVGLSLSGVENKTDWETRTTVSDRYKKVTSEEALKQLMTF